MIELFAREDQCCGCSACEAVCPTKNIVMVPIEKGGYFYPKVLTEDNCLNCQLCIKVCPMKEKKKSGKNPINIYAGVVNDKVVWEKSASGGAFSAICSIYKEEKPIIFGARWNGFDVIMDYCEGVENMEPYRKSKYVAANPNRMYERVKVFLKEGRNVIFSGTPCQINGLVNFLGVRPEKLLLIDFACHGQGAPMVFRKWIDYLEAKYSKKMVQFQFREKKVVKDHLNSNCCSYTFNDKEKIIVERDYYHHAYVKGLCMRSSCEKCKFANNRYADITLADFKNLEVGLPDYDDMKNVSTIMINTEKGERVVEKLKDMQVFKPDLEFVLRYNPKLHKNFPGNPNRNTFMSQAVQDVNIKYLIKKYARILPSEWVEYHCSRKLRKRLQGVLFYLDILWRIPYKIEKIVKRNSKN